MSVRRPQKKQGLKKGGRRAEGGRGGGSPVFPDTADPATRDTVPLAQYRLTTWPFCSEKKTPPALSLHGWSGVVLLAECAALHAGPQAISGSPHPAYGTKP